MKKIRIALWYVFIAVAFLGCSSARMAKLANGNDPQMAVTEVTQIQQDALRDQLDILADQEYLDGSTHLTYARDDLKNGLESEGVLANAAIAKAYFQDARKVAEPRRSFAKRIIEARDSALQAGLRNSSALVEALEDVDSELKSETRQFTKNLSPDDFAEFQRKYLGLEIKAVQFRELNGVNVAINEATDNDAEDLAPNTLRTAALDFKTAENIISQSPRSPEIYNKSVQESVDSAGMLMDVMDVIKGAKGTPENIATQIVIQKRALGELTSNVGKLKANLQSTQLTLQEKEGALKKTEGDLKKTESVLKSQEEQLARASTQVRFQKAMDEARKVLPQSDALVYQQGNTLVFRLKRINFKSGTSVIPESSKPLLTKVDGIIKKLDADKVVVQGHTDSVGAEDVNQRLSTARAVSVATYFSSLRGGYPTEYIGYGESNPIASNETKEGRATNRRVDLVVSVKQ